MTGEWGTPDPVLSSRKSFINDGGHHCRQVKAAWTRSRLRQYLRLWVLRYSCRLWTPHDLSKSQRQSPFVLILLESSRGQTGISETPRGCSGSALCVDSSVEGPLVYLAPYCLHTLGVGGAWKSQDGAQCSGPLITLLCQSEEVGWPGSLETRN